MIHKLKTVQPYFDEVDLGAKTFEVRKNDRNFKVGDFMVLQEWKLEGHFYTGNVIDAKEELFVYTDRQQVSLFGDLEEKPTETKTFPEPLPCGNYMSIHGLIYCLEPVEGWVEVKYLRIDPGAKKNIADRAWVDPDTIRVAYIQEHKELSEKVGRRITPIAWGFGPDVKIDRHKNETSGFDFVNPDDYYWVEEKFLKPKREKHNRRCEIMRSRNAAVQILYVFEN